MPKKFIPHAFEGFGYFDAKKQKRLVFLTNDFTVPAFTIAELFHCRWRIELFFKWIKQHLRIKALYGTSENAVKTQIWIAATVYVLVAIVKKQLNLDRSLYTMLQILSVSLFEKVPLSQLFIQFDPQNEKDDSSNPLELFE
jgi:IS4 transposase